jgi:type IV pilus assembly protein PilA
MFNRLSELRAKRANGDKGFTLIELLVVVVIIGILIAIAIPLYLNYKKGANDKAAESDLRGAVSTLEQCNADNGDYPSALPDGTAAAGSATACTGNVKSSGGTTITYKADTTNSNVNYIAWSTNSGGSGKIYCYASAAGGSVKSVSAVGAAYAASC